MNEIINVIKRGVRGKEPLNIEKIHEMVEYACEDITGVSSSQIEMNSGLQFYDGMSTDEIQQILIKSAADLISLDTPNYTYTASRLLLYSLRKQVMGKLWDHPHIYKHVEKCIEKGVYDKDILSWYEKKDFDRMENWLNHERDYTFTYAGLRQVIDKYLVQDRSNGEIFETPQFMYMIISATLFAKYPKETRMTYVKKYYDAISTFKINIPTPVMSGVRTPIKQYASCVLVDVADTLPSIFSSDMAIGSYVAQRAGIGINAGRIRGINSRIRGGEVQHTGVIPFLKKFEATVKCCTQNGVRGGSATVHFPIWHQEIEDIIVLKNNKGSEDNRVRKLDYSIQLSKLFYERFINDEEITLLSPHEVPELYEAWGSPEFDKLYETAERKTSIKRKKIKAQQLIFDILKERAETGRIYIMNIDHCNTHSSFKDLIKMSNLCQEITLPTDPIHHIDGKGEIALCILSAINVGLINKRDELEPLCDLAVRSLDEIIDHQSYPVRAAEISTRNRRPLGVGIINFAYWLARNDSSYTSPDLDLVHQYAEAWSYYLIKASVDLAEETEPCIKHGECLYSLGTMPIDTYKKDVDELVEPKYNMDWGALALKASTYGIRNSTLMALMPSETSAQISNSTNGIEPPRALVSVKQSKDGVLKQVVPSIQRLKNKYELLWDQSSPEGYLKICAVLQKFIDQGISVNTSYNPRFYEDEKIPMSVMLKHVLMFYKYGGKQLYYFNTYDGSGEMEEQKPLAVGAVDDVDCESCKI